MCGIAGILDPSGAPVPPELMRRAVATMRHRGPDDEGVYGGPGVGLAATRLSILDLSPSGHQPMVDDRSGARLVYNGEVYNYREVAAALGLERLRSTGDTEVVLQSYAKLGSACVGHLNGIYAFAVWDPRRRRLFCARDRLGVKPLYYAWHDGRLLFASEVKTLLALGIPARPNLAAIHEYLAYGVYDHSEETFFDGVLQLPPGHTLTLEKGRMRIERYWDLEAGAYDGGAEEARRDFADLLADSLRLQLRSDVPIAVHVSGGLDSSLMLAAINRVAGGQGELKAFSYYYGEPEYDERPYVEDLVRSLDWEVEYHRLDADEVPSLAEAAMWWQEQPYPGLITLAKHKLIEASRPFGAPVILEGQGGDEIGGGYQYYLGPHVLDLLEAGRADTAAAEVERFAARNELSAEQAFRIVAGGIAGYHTLGTSADGSRFVKLDCLDPAFCASNARALHLEHRFRSHLLNLQYRDVLHTKLQRILRSCDRASMAWSRELRVPLIDHRLVELAFALPGELKIRDGEQRAFMREALRELGFDKLARLPKRAVVDPQREWLQGPLADWAAEILSSESFASRGIFAAEAVREAFRDYRATERPQNSFHVWQWLSVELWFRTFIDAGATWRASAPEHVLAP